MHSMGLQKEIKDYESHTLQYSYNTVKICQGIKKKT